VRVINDMLSALDENSESLPPALPDKVANYLTVTGDLPPWAEPDRILRAQSLFVRHGPLFGVVLMLRSLPVLYAGSFGGAQVLAMTGQLTKNFRRRASETLRFILDAMEPGGLDATGKGIRTTQKVRLMHASVRQFASHSALWKAHPEWGAPINQEELVGTLVAFSYLALDGLGKLGIEVSDQEQEDYLHAWKCIGYVLGIREECLPADIPAAEKLWKAVAKRNFHRTPEGLLLTQEHLKFVKEMVPGHTADSLMESLMRYLMGPKIAVGILGLPKAAWTDVLIGWLRRLLLLERLWIFNNKIMNAILGDISRNLMESLDAYWSEGDTTPFRIPESVGRPSQPGRPA
jgi:hypothetical protein